MTLLAFDVGGNHGQSIDVLLTKGYDKVVSFEANPMLARELQGSYSGESERVAIHNNIVCEHSKGKQFYISTTADGISTTKKEWILESRFRNTQKWLEDIEGKPLIIPSVTLDQAIEAYGIPDFIKVDVEGGELEVFQGLHTCSPKIAFEWTEELWDKHTAPCVELLRGLGYSRFAYQEADDMMQEPKDTEYSSWETCEIHSLINKEHYEKWGLIWVKK